ncbi:uncharacterized protein METZ01_LOCUS283673 [marine metagenome]|jgi:hypothetical protein|uniref:Uncharacterized protein n=1 Tax=marine metagenome TaxID=408172 RepID=A0A382L2I7_9ZZZZ
MGKNVKVIGKVNLIVSVKKNILWYITVSRCQCPIEMATLYIYHGQVVGIEPNM